MHLPDFQVKGRNHLLFFIGCLLLWVALPQAVIADNQVSFDAQAILPENQQSQASYYDLKVQPGETQDLTLQLRNTTADPITVVVAANDATTNKNGTIDYSNQKATLMGGPTFKEMISATQKVQLAAFATQKVTFHLTIPQEGFVGTVLGGFYCYEATTDKADQQAGVTLQNKFAYTIGVKLKCTNDEVAPEFALETVEPGLDNGYLTLFTELSNAAPVLKSRIKLHATLSKKGQPPLETFDRRVSFAPRSRFQLAFDLKNKPLQKGNYQMQISLTDETGKTWQLQKSFKIEGKDEALNQEAVEVEEQSPPIFVYLLIISVIIIICLIWYIIKIQRRTANPDQ